MVEDSDDNSVLRTISLISIVHQKSWPLNWMVLIILPVPDLKKTKKETSDLLILVSGF